MRIYFGFLFFLFSCFQICAEGKHFIFNGESDPETLDPAIITGVTEMRFVDALFEGLTTLDPKTLAAKPGVASSWEIKNKGKEILFHIRADATWSDGTLLRAKDFLYSWKRVLSPETTASYAYQLYPIKNAEKFHKGTIKNFSKVGVKIISPLKLSVTLERPCPYFLDLVAFPTLYPVPEHIVKKHAEKWVRPENIVGNGAFLLKKWEVRQKIIMEKNPKYWDIKNVKLDRVTGYLYDDKETAYKLFLQKKIHWIPSIPETKIDEIIRNPDFYVMPYLGTYFYRFNCKKPPFDDKRVRKALSVVIDRSMITSKILKSGEKPAYFYCPPVAGYKPVKGISNSIEEAKKLLDEAGYGPGKKKFPKIEILYNTSDSHKKIAEYISREWRQHLNIQVDLRNTEWKIFLSEMKSLNFDICRSSWIGDYGDPNTFFDLFVKDGGNNRTGWFSKKYDALLKKTQIELDPEKRLKLFNEMEKILVEDEFPIIPIYIYVNKGMLDESVTGWHQNIRDIHPLKYIDLEIVK
jgi:oligopeptide transport system substrate-binding protein